MLALLAQQKLNFAYRGEIHWHSPYAYLPQLNRLTGQSIADALEITELADCFSRIEHGDASADDFAQVDGNWHLPQQWQGWKQSVNLRHRPVDSPTRGKCSPSLDVFFFGF